ncbi:MAG TPA: hypothetical protein VD971_04400 [Phycisphaerales bacterium]|nr:hypothetical protein [Phycisphaerales bacterium]
MKTASILALSAAAVLAACDNSSSQPAAGTAPAAAPTTGVSVAVQQPGPLVEPADRVRVGPKLPIAIPPSVNAETPGNKLLRGAGEWGPGNASGVTELAPVEGKEWVLVEVEPSNKKSLLGKSVATAERVLPPMILTEGENGQRTEALGFLYEDAGLRKVQLDPDAPLRGLSQAPMLLASRSDQRLWLIFSVPKGTAVQSFWLGPKKMAEWQPAVKVN